MAIEFTVDHDHTVRDDDGEGQLVGTITCSVQSRAGDNVRNLTGYSRPRTTKLPPRTGWLAADGHVYAAQDSTDPFRLPANDPIYGLDHITYRVDFNLTTLSGTVEAVPSTYFPAPSADTTLYLTKVMGDLDQPVMKVRASVYAEDILDVGTAGAAVITAATAADAREAIDAVDDFDFRLDDTRTPSDGSVSRAKLDSDLTGSIGALTSPYFSASTAGVLNADNNTNATAKTTAYGLKHYTNAEEPFYGMRLTSDATNNTLQIGGGNAAGNAATLIQFYTAANGTTITGTLWTSIDNGGFMQHRGDLIVGPTTGGGQRTFSINAAASQFRNLAFNSDGVARLIMRLNNAAESGSDLGSDLEFVTRHDDGSTNVIALKITRATGASTFGALLATIASATGSAGFRLPHGAAPTSPVNGDIWTTTAAVFAQLNGATFTLATLTSTQTFTAKSVDLTTNTLTGTTAQFNTALSDGDFATLAGTETLTNKRIVPRLATVASGSTLAPAGDTSDLVVIDSLATNATISAPTGTPIAGQPLRFRITDDGTVRQLAWNAAYSFVTPFSAPVETRSSTVLYVDFAWNATTSKWDCVGNNSGRMPPRLTTVTSSATLNPNPDICDVFTVTALAADTAISVGGTTWADGQKFTIRIKDNGTTRALSWNAAYRVIGTTLPTATTVSKWLYVTVMYNLTDSKWDVHSVMQQA